LLLKSMKTLIHPWILGTLLLYINIQGPLRTGYSQEKPITKLMETLKDENRAVRAEAVNALLQLGPSAIDPLIGALQSQNVNVRREAAVALGQAKDLRALDPLIAALKDEDPIVGFRAVVALTSLRDPRAVEPLVETLKIRDSVVSYGALNALGEFKDPRAVNPLITASKDANPLFGKLAAGALARIRESGATGRAIQTNKNADIRKLGTSILKVKGSRT
jgi:hypothetical protein